MPCAILASDLDRKTGMTQAHEFPNWEQLYQEKAVESMPWFNPDLDPDLEQALDRIKL